MNPFTIGRTQGFGFFNIGGDNFGVATATNAYRPAPSAAPAVRPAPVNIGLTRNVPYQPSAVIAAARFPGLQPPMRYPAQRIPVPAARFYHAFGAFGVRAFGMTENPWYYPPMPRRATPQTRERQNYEAGMRAALQKPISGLSFNANLDLLLSRLRNWAGTAGVHGFGATQAAQQATYIAAMKAAADLKAKQLASQNDPSHAAPKSANVAAAINTSAQSNAAATIAPVGMTPAAQAQQTASLAAIKAASSPAGFNAAAFYPPGATQAQVAAANARIAAVMPSYAGGVMTPAQVQYQFAQANKAQTPQAIAETKSILSGGTEAKAVQSGRVQDSPAALKEIQTYNQNVVPLGGQQITVAQVNAALVSKSGLVSSAIATVIPNVSAAINTATTPTAAPRTNAAAASLPAATQTASVTPAATGYTAAGLAQTLANRAAVAAATTRGPTGNAVFNPALYYPAGATAAQIAAANARIAAVMPSYAGGVMTPAQVQYQFAQANKAQTPQAIAETKSILSTPLHGEAAAVAAGRVQESAAALKVVQDYNQSVMPLGMQSAKVADVNAALASGAAKTVTEAILQSVPASQSAQTAQFAQPQYSPPVFGTTPLYTGTPSGAAINVSVGAPAGDSASVTPAAGENNGAIIAAVIGALALWFTSK